MWSTSLVLITRHTYSRYSRTTDLETFTIHKTNFCLISLNLHKVTVWTDFITLASVINMLHIKRLVGSVLVTLSHCFHDNLINFLPQSKTWKVIRNWPHVWIWVWMVVRLCVVPAVDWQPVQVVAWFHPPYDSSRDSYQISICEN